MAARRLADSEAWWLGGLEALGLWELEARRLRGFEALGVYGFSGRSCGRVPVDLGRFWRSWGGLESSWDRLRAIWEHLGSSWGGLGWPCEQPQEDDVLEFRVSKQTIKQTYPPTLVGVLYVECSGDRGQPPHGGSLEASKFLTLPVVSGRP